MAAYIEIHIYTDIYICNSVNIEIYIYIYIYKYTVSAAAQMENGSPGDFTYVYRLLLQTEVTGLQTD
jgi:hypothetical protein